MTDNVEALGVGGHDAILDAVVDHFDEVACTVWSTVEVALLGSSPHALPAGSAGCCIDAWSQGREERVEMLDDLVLSTDHQAVAALESPNAAARANVNVVDVLSLELGGAPDIIAIVRVAAIDDDVARSEVWDNVGQRCIH